MIEVGSRFQKLNQTRTADEQDKKLKEVGELYEKQFLREMVKSMRSTISESGLIKTSQAEKIFREQLDQEYVEQWGAKGGIGLGDLVYNQLLEKYGTQLGIKAPLEKPQGPLPLNEKSNYQGTIKPSEFNANKLTVQFLKDLEKPSVGMNHVNMPWEGSILGSKKLGADEYLLDIRHTNGLKSQIVFKGQPTPGVQGQDLQAGDSIGLLSPEARAFFWNIEGVSKSVSE